MELTRRGFLGGMAGILAASVAPSIITTPGLLMPVRKIFVPPGIFNVRDFGAIGDGFTNDCAAFGAAMTAAVAWSKLNSANVEVFVPAGTYYVPSPIASVGTPHGLSLNGAGSGQTHLSTVRGYKGGGIDYRVANMLSAPMGLYPPFA